jgi:hypothetical protein
MAAMYRTLDAGKIVATIERLRARIDERFPGSGLGGLQAAIQGADRAGAAT